MTSGIITLTTDFGYRDPFVGIMKGVMLQINPSAKLVDLSHGIEPQDIMAGALALAASIPYFAPGTVHLVVIDPGVGSHRKPVVIETKHGFFVGPDNGVLSLALKDSAVVQTVELSNTRAHLEPTSSTFHGRDIFAPAAARIAAGTPPKLLGNTVDTFASLTWPNIERQGQAITGEIVYVDHFGNLMSNIRADDLDPGTGRPVITIQNRTIQGISQSYSAAGNGNYLAIFNSWGLLEISRCNGNASNGLGAGVGTGIVLDQAKDSNEGFYVH